jgi:hypothetical protein
VTHADYDRDPAGADRTRHYLLVERPQVLDRAAASHQEQHIALGAPARAREHGGDAIGRALALHRCRVNNDFDCRIAPRERGQDVAQSSRCERSHDADAPGVDRQRALQRRVEQAFRAELFLEAQEALVQRTEARPAHPLHRKLEPPARLVKRRQGP